MEYFGAKGASVSEEKRVFEYVGGGWHFQADEVARCVRDGKLESSLWGHNKSLLEMDIFDEVRGIVLSSLCLTSDFWNAIVGTAPGWIRVSGWC